MDGPPNTRGNDELVAHLVRCMQEQGLVIQEANAPGYRKPGHGKFGLRRSTVRPDVVALDGRRTIFGIVSTTGEVDNQLEALAAKCRLVVICVPEKAADRLVTTFSDTPSWRKLRLLKHPHTIWEEARRPRQASKPMADVRVVIRPA
jgi:hypothetical protein